MRKTKNNYKKIMEVDENSLKVLRCNSCKKEKDTKEFDNSIYECICSKCYVNRKYKKLKKEDIY